MTKKKQYIVLTILTLSLGLLFFPVRMFAADVNTFKDAFSAISTSLFTASSSIEDTEDIVEKYCSVLLNSPAFVENDFVYTAKHSAFVYLLCKQVGEKGSLLDANLFVRTSAADLGLVEYDVDGNDLCSSFGPDCNLAKHIPDLYNKIITDYVNMKQSNIYGLYRNASTDTEIEDQVNVFSLAYFGIKICETSDRSYDTTCRTMKSYIKNARNLLSDVHIFSGMFLLDLAKPIVQVNAKNWEVTVKKRDTLDVCSTKLSNPDSYNPVVCGLYGDTATPSVSFVNLVYNELFYYRLFTAYYLTMLQKYPIILHKSTYHNNYSKIAKKFSSEYTWAKSASSLTFRMLRDMSTSFPFHIGMLMYKEDLDGFGKALSAIAPPIYTLYDKLRNVQAPK